MSHVYEFGFTGSQQEIILEPGMYTFELWGAQGGNINSYAGGKGGYVKGDYNYKSQNKISLYAYVGGQNGYNGGGKGGTYDYADSRYMIYCGNGGGGTDIRTNTTLADRIIVAGGGGGAWRNTYSNSAVTGGDGKGATGTGYGLGNGRNAYFNGYENGKSGDVGYCYGGAGGGGYYGGLSAFIVWNHEWYDSEGFDYEYTVKSSTAKSEGGTGYISSIFTNTSTKNGIQSGDGLIKITLIRHYSHKIYTIGRTLYLDKTEIDETVSKIEIKINGELIDTINEPENNVMYNIDDTLCNFGSNTLTVVSTILLEDGTEEVNEDDIQYIRYGAQIPTNADLNTFKEYLSSMSTQVVDLRNQLADVLTNQGIDVSGINKITDLIKLAEQLTNSNSTEITEYITRITELEAQIQELNEVLNGKVDPAGTAVAGDVLSGKTFINSTGQVVTGTMVNRGGAETVTPGTSNKTLNAGYYSGNITVAGDADLVAANIVSGKNIFGVAGSAKFTGRSATGTVTFAPTATVTGLAFTPRVVYLYPSSNNGIYPRIFLGVIANINGSIKSGFLYRNTNDSQSYYNINATATLTSNGFSLKCDNHSGTVQWCAYE